MKNAKTLVLSATVWLLAAILIGVSGPWTGTASAAVNCSSVTITDAADTDLDGIPDYYECNGFTFYRGLTTFPGLQNKPANATRSEYLDPDSKDLFVVMSRSSTGTQIPNSGNTTNANLFQDITEATGTGGLGTTIHFLDDCSKIGDTCIMSRQLSPSFGQWAARIVEDSVAGSGQILGSTPVGTPNLSAVEATVYTLRTKNFIKENVCNNTTFTSSVPLTALFTCYDFATNQGRKTGVLSSAFTNDTTLTPLIDLYQRQNVAHETGHMMNLIQAPGATATPPHYASSQTGSIMESSVYYKRNVTTSKGKITKVDVIWYMPGSFVSTDQTNMKLK